MAITDKEKGVWGLDQVYNKINQGSIWEYSGVHALFVAGNNTYGYLGLNNRTQYSSPVQIPGTTWVVARLGGGASYGVKSDGTLWSWGYNDNGVLGVNDRTTYSSPVQVPGTDWNTGKFTSSMGRMLSAIKTDGTLWSWGYNEGGQIAQNDTVFRSSPTQIGTDTTWAKVSSVWNTSVAVKTDGTMWTWGKWGALGTQYNGTGGTVTGYSSPAQIPGTTWDTASSSSDYGGMAIRTDGTLWSWGYGGLGVLGNNASAPTNSPVQVPGTTWTNNTYHITNAIHKLGIKTDGTLWSWGSNAYGELGLNNTTKYSSPVQIPGSWSTACMGWGTSCAIKTDGTMWIWGHNNHGSGGINEAGPSKYSSPVQVPGTDWPVGDPRKMTRTNQFLCAIKIL